MSADSFRFTWAALGLACLVPARAAAQESISAERIQRHVAVLAHDSLRGRATPSPGLDAAAAYVADELHRAGLRPVEGKELVVQWPLVIRQGIAGGVRLESAAAGVLEYGRDFAVMPAGMPEVTGRLTPVENLDDTAHVRGRIPLLRLPAGDWSGPAHAAASAGRRAGALGVVLVLDSTQPVPPVAKAGAGMDHAATSVPAVLITPAAARRLLPGAAPPGEITLRIPQRADTTYVPYVVGVLPGRDARLRGEYVVVSAHLDHLGAGAPDARGDSIYNGADDNSSGVAALLELAHALAGLDSGPRRSVLFFATSAEEVCLCGSEHFTRDPPVPLPALVADVNLDGIGRSWQRDTVSAEGSAYSTLGHTVREVARRHPELRLTVVDDQWPDRNYFSTSDQIWFARRGVPSLFLSSTGPDEHYHRPSDEAVTLEPRFTARIARLAGWLVRAIADAPNRPEWDEEARRAIQIPR